MVASANQFTGKVSYKTVKQTFIRQTPRIYSLTYSDGTNLETTGDHPFYIEGKGWINAAELVIRDVSPTIIGMKEAKIVTGNAEDLKLNQFSNSKAVVSVEIIEGETTVYNFEVEDDHTYFVTDAGIWVHNADTPEYTQRAKLDKKVVIDALTKTKDGYQLGKTNYTTYSKTDMETINALDSFTDSDGNKFVKSKDLNGKPVFGMTKIIDGKIVITSKSFNEDGTVSVTEGELTENGINIKDTQKYTASGKRIDQTISPLVHTGNSNMINGKIPNFSGRAFFVEDDIGVDGNPIRNLDHMKKDLTNKFHYENPKADIVLTDKKGETQYLEDGITPKTRKGIDAERKVDIGGVGQKHYGPTKEFTITNILEDTNGYHGIRVEYEFIDNNDQTEKVQVVHATEINARIYKEWRNNGRKPTKFQAGTWIGTAGDYVGNMDGPHLHLTCTSHREECRKKHRGEDVKKEPKASGS